MDNQQPVINAQGVIQSQFVRRLQQVPYRANSTATLDVPRDDVFKRLYLRLTGSVLVTFSAGSPVIGGLGFFARIVNKIEVVQNGQDTIKSVEPHMLRMQNILLGVHAPERAHSTSASAMTTRLAQTEQPFGGVAYPATTEYLLFNESVVVYFEYPFAYSKGKQVSLWNTKGLSSAEIRLSMAPLTNLIEDGNTATVVYTEDLALAIDVELTSVPSIPREKDFMLYKQFIRRQTFSAEVRDYLIDLPRGNYIAGLHILVRNGGTNKRLSDIAVKDIALLVNGQRIIQRSTFLTLQQKMRQEFSCKSPKATAVNGITHELQGYAYMHLVRDGDVRTALDTSLAAGVDLVQLAITTASSSGTDAATYTTNPVEVSIMVDELCEPVKRF